MNSTAILGLVISIVTGVGIILTTYYTGRRDKDSVVKEVYEQRIQFKEELLIQKDEELLELKAVIAWYDERIKTKDRVIKGLLQQGRQDSNDS